MAGNPHLDRLLGCTGRRGLTSFLSGGASCLDGMLDEVEKRDSGLRCVGCLLGKSRSPVESRSNSRMYCMRTAESWVGILDILTVSFCGRLHGIIVLEYQ